MSARDSKEHGEEKELGELSQQVDSMTTGKEKNVLELIA